jgi:CheY-like chemotaxis protein
MKILVVDDIQHERQTIAQALGQAGYSVEETKDPKVALTAIEREPVRVIVLVWPKTGGADFIKRVRSFEASEHTYVLAILDKQPHTEITALFAAGADDFLRRPVIREELVGRVDAPKRIQKWVATEKKAPLDWSSCVDLRRLRACREMGAIVAEDLGQLLGQTLGLAEGWMPELEDKPSGATIPMSLATEQSEVRVSIVVDAESLRAMAGLLLGDANAPRAALDDIVREMTNTAGGAVKRAAMSEDVTLTTGLPADDCAVPQQGETSRCWVASLAEPKVRIGIVGEVRRRENQRVAAAALREGMVVAADLFSDSGALVVRAGTRLSATTAQRVAAILGQRFVVEVACAA